MRFLIGSFCLSLFALKVAAKTTADRIKEHGYPVGEYTVQTSDGYILKLFRIPFSPTLKNENDTQKVVVFLQHGLLSSSDCWVLSGPENALPYQLANAGYDVWMGNARGNVYSREHAFKSPHLPPFWRFTWNEIGKIDLPAMIDFVLYKTDKKCLEYVGHSQGTTSLLVLLSSSPQHNDKINTVNFLAPVAYMDHMQSPFAKVFGPLVGNPTALTYLFGANEFLPNNEFFSLLAAEGCEENSVLQPICTNALFAIAGSNSSHLNNTVLPDVVETHPAGCSALQLIHYLQEYKSGHFRHYDFGLVINSLTYGSLHPPDYVLSNIKPKGLIYLSYSYNDYLAAVRDVERLAEELGNKAELHPIEYMDWNHLDFLWARQVKRIINDYVITTIRNSQTSCR